MLIKAIKLLKKRKLEDKLFNKKYVGKRSVGQRTEFAAINFLTNKGLILIDANVYYRFGEIDLVFLEQNTIVFVEVKYRSKENYGTALEAVTAKQARRLQKSAEAWLQQYDTCDRFPSRYDLVAISGPMNNLQFHWVKNIFQ